jgi:polyisoprenyl-phosphate glycosyltransferase
LIPQLGFRSAHVYYNRQTRFAGKTSYSLSRMLSLAFTGITSFTEIPLKIITVLGILVSLFSFGLGIWAFVVKLILKAAIPGWASTVIPVYFLGGIQLLCLGVIGQYLAKIYAETKARPRFIVDRSI